MPISFIYGNTTQKLNRKVNSYNWKFFIKAKDGKTADYIQKVEIQLHPTFSPSLRTLDASNSF